MRQRSRENQQLMAQRIMERFDAVDVTGLSGWERERRLVKAGWYAELTAAESRPRRNLAPTGDDQADKASERMPRRSSSSPSVSSIQPSLFPDQEAA